MLASGECSLSLETDSTNPPRDALNPLSRINHASPPARELTSRPRLQFWLAPQKSRSLDLNFGAIVCCRAYTSGRVEGVEESKASPTGVVKRRFTFAETVGLRHDLGRREPNPMDRPALRSCGRRQAPGGGRTGAHKEEGSLTASTSPPCP